MEHGRLVVYHAGDGFDRRKWETEDNLSRKKKHTALLVAGIEAERLCLKGQGELRFFAGGDVCAEFNPFAAGKAEARIQYEIL